MRSPSRVLVALLLASCSDAPPAIDAGTDSGRSDSGPPDGGGPCIERRDGGPTTARDAGPATPPPALDCGTPEFPTGTPLRRAPYLQSTTGTSVRVAWTSTGGAAATLRFTGDPASGTWTSVDAAMEMFATTRTEDTEDYVAYDATISGLEPGRAYCYEIREGDVVLARNLRLETAWDGADRPIRMLVVGDSGTGSSGQLALRDRMLGERFDMFLHMGDMAYDVGSFTEFEENFFGVYADLLHAIPTYPTMGNHEYATDSGQPYLDVYYLFENAAREADRERYYSYDWGNIHFVSLESNDIPLLGIRTNPGRFDDDQIDWLRADLAASDAEWKIAFFHHPPYTSSTRGPSRLVRDLIVPVLEEGGVDLVLVGHDHHYERATAISGGCEGAGDPSAITYVVSGAGGAGLRDIAGESWFTVAFEDQRHTYLDLTIHGCTASAQALTAEGDVVDEWSLDGCD